MNPATATDPAEDAATLNRISLEAEAASRSALVMAMFDSVTAQETIMEDLLTVLSVNAPEIVENWRDRTAGTLQRIEDGGGTDTETKWLGMYSARFMMLRGALENVGRPYTGAEIVSLDAHRLRASRQSATHDKGDE